MKFSVFTVGMPEYTVEDGIKKLSELGYDGVEFRVCNIPEEFKTGQHTPSYWGYNKCTVELSTIEERAEELTRICEDYNIEICSLATYSSIDKFDEIEKVMKAAKIMGCPRIRVIAPNYDGKENYNVLLERSIDQLKKVEELAKKYGVKANIEMHMGNIVPSASAAYRLVSKFDSRYIGVIYDTGNMVYEGYEQYNMGLEILGEYLDHVHIKNAKNMVKEILEDGTVKWETQWSPLKSGQVDCYKFIRLLKKIDFNGYVSFEDFSNEDNTDDKLKNNLEYILGILT